MFRRIYSRRFVFQLILVFVIFTLATLIGLGIPITIIFNHTGYPAEQRERSREFFHRLRQKGAVIFEVEEPTTIVENLERRTHAFIA